MMIDVGVQKFRTIEQMNDAPVERQPGAAFDRFIRHCARFRRLARRTYAPGVLKFRSMDEAQAARQSHVWQPPKPPLA